MRFQDAAKDARAVVYAAIQADPLVRRVASLLADATPAELWLARAAMNGERTEAESWRRMFPALFGEGCEADVREHPGHCSKPAWRLPARASRSAASSAGPSWRS